MDVKAFIDTNLLNLHQKAVSTDNTRKRLQFINIRHKGGALHIASTNGRMLFHTVIPDEAASLAADTPDFAVNVKLNGRIKFKRGRTEGLVTFGDGTVKVEPCGADAVVLVAEDGTDYPDYNVCEAPDGHLAAVTEWATFDPDALKATLEYCGTKFLHHPYFDETKATGGYVWKACGDRCDERRATVMPLRVA